MTPRFRRSFAFKLTLMALMASALASVVLMATFAGVDFVTSKNHLQSRLDTLAQVIGKNSSAALVFEDKKAAGEVLAALDAEKTVVSACLYNESKALFSQYSRNKAGNHCAPDDRSGQLYGDHLLVAQSIVKENAAAVGTLYVYSEKNELIQRAVFLLRTAVLLLLIALIVGASAGFLLQSRMTRPIHELANAMNRVMVDQDLETRVTIVGDNELTMLSHGFNSMVSDLEQRYLEKLRFEEKLQHQALFDDLTALPNRRLLFDRLSQAAAAAQRTSGLLALLYIDLDGFKLVNDSLGHAIGDELLVQVANRLSQRVRVSDTLARLGGDEFAVILSTMDRREDAGRVALGLLDALSSSFDIQHHSITISASIGVSFLSGSAETPLQLLQQADNAMYMAKKGGKNSFAFFENEMGESARERLNLETELRGAIDRGEITVHYQPEYEVGSLTLVRFEALARWNHPTLGMIPPDKFIPIAEESGLIIPLGSYIMRRACEKAVEIQALSIAPVQMAVNVSSAQFVKESFVDDVTQILEETKFPAHLLQLELTESVMLTGVTRATQCMKRLSELGVELAMDDFGTGYSSFGYLNDLPFNAIKIDRGFVQQLSTRPESKAMMRSLVMLAHSLGMKVIVEGVETEAQLDLISSLGGNEIQGYLLGRPSPDPERFISSHSKVNASSSDVTVIERAKDLSLLHTTA